MIVEFKWIQTFTFLTAALQFTAAAEQHPPSFTVRVGDEVTLSCENVIDGQQRCDSTVWLFSVSRDTEAVELVELGKIVQGDKSKSDRLSVTENCSLVIKKVTVEDVGRYTCRQFDKYGRQQGSDSHVDLSLVTMTEQKNNDEVTLSCSVSTFGDCRHTVKWLYDGNNTLTLQDLKTSQSSCFASVIPLTPDYMDNLFTCEVTDGNKVQQFPFSLQSSGEKPGEDTKTATTKPPKINDASTDWTWLYATVAAVVVVALLIITVKIITWRRSKGKETRMNDTVGLTSNPAGTQPAAGTSPDTADPEDGVSYASISYTKKTKSKTQSLGKDEDKADDEAVTYTTVKAPSFSADPSNLYATVNTPNE